MRRPQRSSKRIRTHERHRSSPRFHPLSWHCAAAAGCPSSQRIPPLHRRYHRAGSPASGGARARAPVQSVRRAADRRRRAPDFRGDDPQLQFSGLSAEWTAMSEIVLVEKEGPLALITLNRPEKLNALDYALIDRLMEVLDAIEDDDDTRVLVLTGAGNRAFSSGADIACFAASVRRGQAVALREFVRRGQRLTGRIETFP